MGNQEAISGDIKQMKLGTLVHIAQVLNIHPWHLFREFYEANDVGEKLKISDDEIQNLKLHKVPSVHSLMKVLYPGDDSSFIRDVTFPDGELVPINYEFVKIWEIMNSGCVIWDRRRLICVDDRIALSYESKNGTKTIEVGSLVPRAQEVPIDRTLPGKSVKIHVSFQTPRFPGTILSYWKMVNEAGEECFPSLTGLYCKVTVFQ